MIIEKLKPILKGYVKGLIAPERMPTRTGGTDEAEYCYSTWLRHLIMANRKVTGVPENVIELGPGDTLGIGIAALLSGVKFYVGLDLIRYWNAEANLQMFDRIVELYRRKTALSDESKYPCLIPFLEDYSFPTHILDEARMNAALAPDRVSAIREELHNAGLGGQFVQFFNPWHKEIVPARSFDFVFSQAVLQYTDLDAVYESINYWLRPGGLTAHAIDFSSHGITKTWNGHWSFSDLEWKQYSFRRKILLNRAPFSVHKNLLESLGFDVILVEKNLRENKLSGKDVATRFKNIPEEDLKTGSAFMLSRKRIDSLS